MSNEYMSAELAPQENQSPALTASTEIASSRAAQEVQAAMIVAMKFPRNELQCIANIRTSCGRLRLAEAAQYSYKKGGALIEGASIRLAEVIAQRWKNFDFGVVELERRPGESQCQAYAWDMESNVRRVMTFTVRHWRDTRSGGYALKDEREIYELIANMGARRLRACILSVIPGDVVEEAQDACNDTLIEAEKGVPIEERRGKMVKAFATIEVSEQDLTNYLGHDVGAATLNELVRLRKVFTTIKDGISTKGEFFADTGATTAPTTKKATTKKATTKAATKTAPPKEEAPADTPPPLPDDKDDEIPGLGKSEASATSENSKQSAPNPGKDSSSTGQEPAAASESTDDSETGEPDLHAERRAEITAGLKKAKVTVAAFTTTLTGNGMLSAGADWKDLPVEVLDDILAAWETLIELIKANA